MYPIFFIYMYMGIYMYNYTMSIFHISNIMSSFHTNPSLKYHVSIPYLYQQYYVPISYSKNMVPTMSTFHTLSAIRRSSFWDWVLVLLVCEGVDVCDCVSGDLVRVCWWGVEVEVMVVGREMEGERVGTARCSIHRQRILVYVQNVDVMPHTKWDNWYTALVHCHHKFVQDNLKIVQVYTQITYYCTKETQSRNQSNSSSLHRTILGLRRYIDNLRITPVFGQS